MEQLNAELGTMKYYKTSPCPTAQGLHFPTCWLSGSPGKKTDKPIEAPEANEKITEQKDVFVLYEKIDNLL